MGSIAVPLIMDRGKLYDRTKDMAGKSNFSYTGSVELGTTISFGMKGNSLKITPDAYSKMLTNFRGLTVNIGTSRTAPPKGSLGEWFKDYEGRAVTSYVGPILIREGYAEKIGRSEIRVSGLR